MRKLAVAAGAIAVYALSIPTTLGHAADMTVTAKKVRHAEVRLHRAKIVRDPCLNARQNANRFDPYRYDRPNLVYVHGNSYRAGFCIDGDQGPAYRPFWAWGY